MEEALRRLPLIASVGSMLVACLTLVGWIADDTLLASGFVGGYRMSPLTMLGLLAGGAALALQLSPPVEAQAQRLARALALAVLALGGLALTDILVGATPGFEQQGFARLFGYADAALIKGASPQAALSLLFLGTALLLLDYDSRRARMQVYLSSSVALLIGALALLGYGFGASSLYEMTPTRAVSINAAAAVILLALGTLSARMEGRLLAILTGDNLSGLVARRLLAAAVSVPLLLALVAIVGERVGRYDSAFGAALLIVLNIAIFLALIWRSVEMLHQVETEQQQAEAALQRAYQSLEQRVQERTAELAIANDGLKREIAERERIEQERARLLVSEQAARQQAENDSCLKDEFLNTVSHELRAPLNTVRGWIALLRAGQLSEAETERALATVERGGRELDQRVNDLLDVSRLVSGRLHLQLRPVELPPIIEAVVESSQAAAASKGIELQTQIDAQAGAVWGDAQRLQQIVWNLVSNAIKFTPAGGQVSIAVQTSGAPSATGEAGERVEIVVRDTGAGITSDLLPFVFDHFRQADGSRTRGQRGLGVGLTIVRHLVEMHGGSVQIESSGAGAGVTSTVRLPAIKAQMPQRREALPNAYSPLQGLAELPKNERRAPRLEQPSASGGSGAAERQMVAYPANLKGLRLLIIDLDREARRQIAETLEHGDAVVRTAASASDALMVLASWTPDIVVFDMRLYCDFEPQLRERLAQLEGERGDKIPVVALTAAGRVEDRLSALRAGFKMQVPSPLEPAELLAVVSSLASRLHGKLYL